MNEIVYSLIENGVWTPVLLATAIATGTRIISGKWVWKNKLNEVGQVLKNKSRWVARGFTQIFGLNYTDTFAPTPSQTVIKILLAHAAQHFLLVYQYDFKTAFLNSLIGDDEEIYVEQPRWKRHSKWLTCSRSKFSQNTLSGFAAS